MKNSKLKDFVFGVITVIGVEIVCVALSFVISNGDLIIMYPAVINLALILFALIKRRYFFCLGVVVGFPVLILLMNAVLEYSTYPDGL